MKFSQLDYCQYLLSSQLNYTLINLSDHVEGASHDQINWYLRVERKQRKVSSVVRVG